LRGLVGNVWSFASDNITEIGTAEIAGCVFSVAPADADVTQKGYAAATLTFQPESQQPHAFQLLRRRWTTHTDENGVYRLHPRCDA
jgi:hypothetical protein